jgi:outer membrane protein assembly factor BamB
MTHVCEQPRQRRSLAGLSWVPLLAFAASACGGDEGRARFFSTNWKSDAGQTIARVEERLRAAPRPRSLAVAVGVTDGGLVGADLSGGRPWRYGVAVSALPAVSPNGVVIGTGGGKAFALDGKDGRVLFSVPAPDYVLRGGADDGNVTVLSLAHRDGRSSRLLAVDRSGNFVLDVDTEIELGRPAVRAGVAFVPWGGQWVSAIELGSQRELGRVLARDLVSHALDIDGTLYFGQQALVRFDQKIRFAESFQATRFTFKTRSLPGTPVWLGSGVEPAPVDRTASAKIRLFAAPKSQGAEVVLASNAYAGTYFRVAYAFAGDDGRLLWTDAFAGDVVGGAAAAAGFVFCDASGKVHLYDAAGGTGPVVDLGAKLVVCSVGASGLEIVGGQARGSLAKQIEQSLAKLDPNMAAAEKLLLEELGKIDDPEVTRILIAFVRDGRLPPELRERAGKLLAARRNGEEFMLAALERHYDFVSGETPPPVGPLADALGALGERRAAPLLARHLNDPANSVDDVERAAQALETLATPAELSELRTFFALYRATADETALVNAAVSAGSALFRIGGSEGRTLVERAIADPLTQADVRTALSKLVAPKPSDAPAASPAATNAAAPAQAASATATAKSAPPPATKP